MSSIFISFIGRGKWADGQSVYQKTKYDFGNDVICEASCFADAVRQCGKYTFDQVLFIGTPSSSWSTLLENIPGEEDFCLELLERESKKQELDDEREKSLTESLCRAWGKPVRLLLNPPQLLEDNAEKIYDSYVRELLEAGNDILLDITHSFRWMPILLTSALSFKDAFPGCGSSIEIIYGELGEGKNVSPVRCLDILVKERKIADAVTLFFQKFESGPLSEMLKPYWPKGADAVNRLGMYIQGNLFLPLLFDCSKSGFPVGQPLNRLKNALSAFSEESSTAWVIQVQKDLKRIYERLTAGDPPARLTALAQMLADRKLYGQAIMAVCLAAEQSLALAYGFDRTPSFEDLRRMKDGFKKICSRNKPAWDSAWEKNPVGELFSGIFNMRNLIAHGGFCNNDQTNPSPEALPNQFENALNRLGDLQKYLQRNPLPPFHAKENDDKNTGAGK